MTYLVSAIWENIIPIIVACVSIIAIYIYYKFAQFRKIGLPFISNPLKRMLNVMIRTEGIAYACSNVYSEMKTKGAKFAGCYLPFPVLVPIDPEVVKCIMQKDFNYFVNRGIYYNEQHDPLSAHLFFIEDGKWRNLRAKLTPTFTSGKLKMMFNTILETNNQMKLVLDQAIGSESFEIKDLMLRLNSDIIGSCAFGLDISSLKDPDVPFRQQSKKLFHFNFFENIILMLSTSMPAIARKLGIGFNNREAAKYYLDLITETVAYREEKNIYRKDFMHLLIQLKNKGKLTDDESLHADTDDEKDKSNRITINELAAQAFVFFTAGFETSSSVISFAVYELALHSDIQERVRKEVNTVMEKYNEEITYECIMEMTYLEMVVNESLRKYPTLPILNRVANTDYKLPDSDIVIKNGTAVFISTKGLHHDPEYYPEPEKFDPERFTQENKNKRHPYTFLPFGEGPRACIGLRFGMLQTKVALAVLVRNYQFTLDSKTSVPLQADPAYPFISIPLGGIWVNIKRITN